MTFKIDALAKSPRSVGLLCEKAPIIRFSVTALVQNFDRLVGPQAVRTPQAYCGELRRGVSVGEIEDAEAKGALAPKLDG